MSRLVDGPLKRSVAPGLEERSAFVAGPLLTAAIGRDGHVCEVLRSLRIGEAVDAVRNDADHDAVAVDGLAIDAPGTEQVCTARRVALRRDATAADDRAIGAPDRTHPPEPGERVERARVDARLD